MVILDKSMLCARLCNSAAASFRAVKKLRYHAIGDPAAPHKLESSLLKTPGLKANTRDTKNNTKERQYLG